MTASEIPSPKFSIGEPVIRIMDTGPNYNAVVIDRAYWKPDYYPCYNGEEIFTMGWMYRLFPEINLRYRWIREQDLRPLPKPPKSELETEKELVIVR